MEEEKQILPNIKTKLSYPYSDEYEYTSKLKIINLDQTREECLLSGKGFVIKKQQSSLKKNLKDPNSIFSTRFGQTLTDMNAHPDRYKCDCGATMGRLNDGITCKNCGTKVKFVDDDFEYFGWIVLRDYYVIHPILYAMLDNLLGKERKDNKASYLENIIKPINTKDEDGHLIDISDKLAEQPFYGIGIMGLKERYQDVLNYYYNKNPKKEETYELLRNMEDTFFTHSIPVYTIHLRPFKPDASKFEYEDSNGLYNMMAKLQEDINDDNLKMARQSKPKDQLLYDIQMKYMKIYEHVLESISKKKGYFRTVFGGRYNFASRSVIVPDPSLRIDEVKLPYPALLELLQLQIVNLLQRLHQYNYINALKEWTNAKNNPSEHGLVYSIVKALVEKDNPNRKTFLKALAEEEKDGSIVYSDMEYNALKESKRREMVGHKRGIPLLINRNPTINYGSILQMFCVGINDNYTMSMPLQVLPLLAADFDGDTLNILYIHNKNYFEAANRVLNPRNAMYISKNDGTFNNLVNHKKDLIINLNGILQLARKNYSQDQLNRIRLAKTLE